MRNPATFRIEQATKFKTIVNLKTTKSLGNLVIARVGAQPGSPFFRLRAFMLAGGDRDCVAGLRGFEPTNVVLAIRLKCLANWRASTEYYGSFPRQLDGGQANHRLGVRILSASCVDARRYFQ
jgi:hypothetical protein